MKDHLRKGTFRNQARIISSKERTRRKWMKEHDRLIDEERWIMELWQFMEAMKESRKTPETLKLVGRKPS
jgi:phage antirepressor YoqD-like protein